MSSHRSLMNNEVNSSRDPRNRDRSRSDIRRPSRTDLDPSLVTTNMPLRQAQSMSTNGLFEFFKTLGLNSQLIQALINANPQSLQQIQQLPQQPLVNNTQDFALFLNKSYGLNSTLLPTPNQSVNRDPRRRPIPPTVTNPLSSTHILTNDVSPSNSYSNLIVSNNNQVHISNNSSPSSSPLSIDESYKNYISTIDQTFLDDDMRKKIQRIALLDNELDKLHRMNIELRRNIEIHSRRRASTKDKDPLLKENENLQNELVEYIKTLKITMMNNYPTFMLSNNSIIKRR